MHVHTCLVCVGSEDWAIANQLPLPSPLAAEECHVLRAFLARPGRVVNTSLGPSSDALAAPVALATPTPTDHPIPLAASLKSWSLSFLMQGTGTSPRLRSGVLPAMFPCPRLRPAAHPSALFGADPGLCAVSGANQTQAPAAIPGCGPLPPLCHCVSSMAQASHRQTIDWHERHCQVHMIHLWHDSTHSQP